MDDTYIHLAFGRSLLTSDPLCFNTGQPSSGFTSPLWLVPSALASLAGGHPAPVLLMVMSLAAACAALLAAGPAGSAAALTGPFLFHASSGMETGLACLFVALLWRRLGGGARPLKDGLLLAGAALARPELAVLALPFLQRQAKASPRGVIPLLLPSLAAGAAWAAWNLHATGLLLPSTFHAKAAAFPPAAGPLLSLSWRLAASAPLVLPAGIAASVSMVSRRMPEGQVAPLLLLAAAVTQPNPWFQLRYYVPALFALGLTATAWLDGLTGRARRIGRPLLILSSLPALAWFAGLRLRATADVAHIDVLPARFVASSATPGDVVAAADIGAMKWITGLEILDLDGLVTPYRLPGAGRAGWAWIAERADWLAAFPDQYSDLLDEAGDRVEFLTGFRSPACVICGSDSVAVWRIAD